MDVAALYRVHGPAILAACRRLVASDAIAARLAPQVFVRVQHRLGARDAAMLIAQAAQDAAAELPGPRLLRDLAPPSEAEVARARDRFTRGVYEKTLPLVERDQRPPRILRWLKVYAPIHVALAATLGIFLAAPTVMRPHPSPADGAGLVVYVEHSGVRQTLAPGMRVRHGDRLRAEVTPAGFRYVTVLVGPRVIKHLDNLPKDARDIPLDEPIVVEEEHRIRVWAQFAEAPRGLPAKTASIELDVE